METEEEERQQQYSELGYGDVVSSENGDYSFRIISIIGDGRCCVVYSAESIRDGTKVALKFYEKGAIYDVAFQREQFIFEKFCHKSRNIVLCCGYFSFKGVRVQVLELLQSNIRQIIYGSNRRGLSPWIVQKFAKDILTGLNVLHMSQFVHGDLKTENVMWSEEDGMFKILDFGLTFHVNESGLHQIQSSGYRSPESSEWNKYVSKTLRKQGSILTGTYSNLSRQIPSFYSGLNKIADNDKYGDPPPSESSGVFSQSTCSNATLNDIEEERLPRDNDQEWRKTEVRRRSAIYPSSSHRLERPGTSADIWSFGCLMSEVFTGHKLFKADDKMVSILKPHQLVEMKFGSTEIRYDEAGKNELFSQIKDLILKCLTSDPNIRISAEDALNHEFLLRKDLFPTIGDVNVPSNLIQLINVIDEDLSLEEAEHILNDIRKEAEKHGKLLNATYVGNHAYLEFAEASFALRAQPFLSKRVFRVREFIKRY